MNNFCDGEKIMMSVLSNVSGVSTDVLGISSLFNDSDMN